MRNAFTKKLTEIALKNKDVILITNDAPTPHFLEFQKKVPQRFINAGLAEQHMTGMAAGLALSGKIPVTYSIVPFVMMRCYEQVRDDICYQNVNAKIIGIGAGIVYSTLGGTHTPIEDISLARGLPNLTIVTPADLLEAEKVAEAIFKIKGPVYVRLSRTGEPAVYEKDYKFEIGKGVYLSRGKDITVIGYGSILHRVKQASKELKKEGIGAEVINLHTIKPLDEASIYQSIKKTGAVVTIEEHGSIGGLKSIIAEILVGRELKVPFKAISLDHQFLTNYGKQTDILDMLGFSVSDIKKTIRKVVRQK